MEEITTGTVLYLRLLRLLSLLKKQQGRFFCPSPPKVEVGSAVRQVYAPGDYSVSRRKWSQMAVFPLYDGAADGFYSLAFSSVFLHFV